MEVQGSMIRRAQATADDDRLRTLESVLGCLSVAVVALDRDARVVAVNPAFAHLHIHKVFVRQWAVRLFPFCGLKTIGCSTPRWKQARRENHTLVSSR